MTLKRITTSKGEIFFVDAKTGQRVEVDSKFTNKTSSTILRFKTLLGLGQFVTILGWIIFIAGIIAIVIGIATLKENSGTITLIGGIAGLINGVLIVAIGQIISCFVSIEHNTYETADILKSHHLDLNKEVQQSR